MDGDRLYEMIDRTRRELLAAIDAAMTSHRREHEQARARVWRALTITVAIIGTAGTIAVGVVR